MCSSHDPGTKGGVVCGCRRCLEESISTYDERSDERSDFPRELRKKHIFKGGFRNVNMLWVWQNTLVGGETSNIFYVHQENWGRFPIWRAYFSNGLKPPTRNTLVIIKLWNLRIKDYGRISKHLFFVAAAFWAFLAHSSQCTLGGGFKYLLFSPRSLGMMIQFDKHIFQLGWFNHQLDYCSLPLFPPSDIFDGSPTLVISQFLPTMNIHVFFQLFLASNYQFDPEKLPKPNRKGLSSNHPFFSGSSC